jgi:hypothetical protein
MLHRKRLPDELIPAFDAFHRVVNEIEPAKVGLTDVVPGSRLPGRPLDDALVEFIARSERASALMPAWRRPELEAVWSACAGGLAAARADAAQILQAQNVNAKNLKDGHEPSGFGGLLAIVETLLDRLEPFVAAEARFEELRRRG